MCTWKLWGVWLLYDGFGYHCFWPASVQSSWLKRDPNEAHKTTPDFPLGRSLPSAVSWSRVGVERHRPPAACGWPVDVATSLSEMRSAVTKCQYLSGWVHANEMFHLTTGRWQDVHNARTPPHPHQGEIQPHWFPPSFLPAFSWHRSTAASACAQLLFLLSSSVLHPSFFHPPSPSRLLSVTDCGSFGISVLKACLLFMRRLSWARSNAFIFGERIPLCWSTW